MYADLTFRILLALLFVGFVAHRGYYTRKFSANDNGATQARQQNRLLVIANMLSIPALAATILYLATPRWMAWSSLPFPAWLRWGGVAVAVAGFALLQWAHLTLSRNWSDTPRLVEAQVLITQGPYRWIRHPIYTAFLLIMGAILLLSANWFLGLLWIGLTAIEIASRISFEESLLAQNFDGQYQTYAKTTGRLLPRIGGQPG